MGIEDEGVDDCTKDRMDPFERSFALPTCFDDEDNQLPRTCLDSSDDTEKNAAKELKALQNSVKSTADAQFFFSFDMPWNRTRNLLRDTFKEAQLGEISPNPSLVNLADRSSISLLSLFKNRRPIVLNFGSCT